jgi:hypothetical protein
MIATKVIIIEIRKLHNLSHFIVDQVVMPEM